MTGDWGQIPNMLGYWPWYLLAQPALFPERLIAADPEHFLRFIFDTWTAEVGAIDNQAFAVYLRALSNATIASICADYRASFSLDLADDAADRAAARRIICPLLVVTGDAETQLADAPDDPVTGNQAFARSSRPFDVWFRGRATEILGIDFTQPLPPMEPLWDWQASRVTA